MAVKQYDPKLVSCIIGGKIISGFQDGTFIEVERNEQAFTLKVGVDGEGARSKSNNRSGKITLTLMQSSSSNDDLTAFALLDELSNKGAVPAFVKDNLGTTLMSAVTAWVQKFPKITFAKEIEGRQWVLESDEIDIFLGGNS